MVPDVVTFWHGPLDALRRLCLRSQVAAGHKVTVYSFEPLTELPDGVGNAEAEAILPHSFSEKLRPAEPDGSVGEGEDYMGRPFVGGSLLTRSRDALSSF